MQDSFVVYFSSHRLKILVALHVAKNDGLAVVIVVNQETSLQPGKVRA